MCHIHEIRTTICFVSLEHLVDGRITTYELVRLYQPRLYCYAGSLGTLINTHFKSLTHLLRVVNLLHAILVPVEGICVISICQRSTAHFFM